MPLGLNQILILQLVGFWWLVFVLVILVVLDYEFEVVMVIWVVPMVVEWCWMGWGEMKSNSD